MLGHGLRRGSTRPAAVLHGSAFVRAGLAMLEVRLAGTSNPAAPELSVKLLKNTRADLCDRDIAECSNDGSVDQCGVVVKRRLIGLVNFHPGAQGVGQGRLRGRVPLQVDLSEQA